MDATGSAPDTGLGTPSGDIERFFGLPVVESKFVPPSLPEGHTARDRVTAAITATGPPVVAVRAGAGYGKTTAVLDAVAGVDPGDVAWLSVDAYDTSELAFWAHVICAVDRVRPTTFLSVRGTDEHVPTSDGNRLAASLLGALRSCGPLTLVLDDVHRLASPVVWDQLALFCDRLPTEVRVIVTSRSTTALPVERWLAERRVTLVDEATLRFDDAEAGRLLAGLAGRSVTDEEVAGLVQRTEGWVCGLLLEALAGAPSLDPGEQAARTTLDYLAREVLDDLDEHDRSFLLSISVLHEIDDGLCRAVTGEVDAGERLRALDTVDLFLVPVDDNRDRLRFHHIFRELLTEELHRRHPEAVPGLHRRAAAALGDAGDVLGQIEQLLAAGDDLVAFDLMVVHATVQRSAVTAGEFVARFPVGFILESPHRMLDLAFVYSFAGEWESAEMWGERAAVAMGDAGDIVFNALLLLFGAVTVGGRGQVDQARQEFERCLAMCRDTAGLEPLLVRYPLLASVRLELWLSGDLETARQRVDQVRTGPSVNEFVRNISAPTITARMRFLEGDPVAAGRLARSALASMEQMEVPPGVPAFEALLTIADSCIETGQLEEAHRAIARAAELADQPPPPSGRVLVALRTIEYTAAAEGPHAAGRAAAAAYAEFEDLPLGAFRLLLAASCARWLGEAGSRSKAAEFRSLLPHGPQKALAEARLALEEHRFDDVAQLVAAAADGSYAEQFESRILVSAARGYDDLIGLIDEAPDATWSFVQHGPTLLRHLHGLGGSGTGGARALLDRSSSFSPAFRPGRLPTGSELTERERRLVMLLPSHLTYDQIADELLISVNTVKSNLKMLYRKLDVSSRTDAVDTARSLGLI